MTGGPLRVLQVSVLAEGLRECGGVYTAGPPSGWTSRCPVCDAPHGLALFETIDDEGRLACVCGCDPADARSRLVDLALGTDGQTAGLDVNGASVDGREVFRLLTGDELLALPEPSWLVRGLVPAAGLTVLYGPSGAGKSFAALDWALCVASGVPWFGRDVEPRWVVYVAGEGRAGLGQRYRAWLEARGRSSVERVRFLADAVNLLDRAEIDRARRTLATLPERPGLLVVDTMARAMPGGDENAARDVGLFVHAVDALRDGGAALVVHHTGHDGERERGSSALAGAADARLQLARDGRSPRLTLANPKQKDAAEHAPVDLRLEACAGSLVLSLVPAAEAAREAHEARDELREVVLAYVVEHGPTSQRKVIVAVRRRAVDVREALQALEMAGAVHRTSKGYEARPASPDAPGTHPRGALGGGVSEEGGRGTESLPSVGHAPRPDCVPASEDTDTAPKPPSFDDESDADATEAER